MQQNQNPGLSKEQLEEALMALIDTGSFGKETMPARPALELVRRLVEPVPTEMDWSTFEEWWENRTKSWPHVGAMFFTIKEAAQEGWQACAAKLESSQAVEVQAQNPWHDDMSKAPRGKKLDLYCSRNRSIYQGLSFISALTHGGQQQGWLDPQDKFIYPSEKFSHWKLVDAIKPPRRKTRVKS